MNHLRSTIFLLFITLAITLFQTGCSNEKKLSKHIQKAAEFQAKENYESAEIEYLNAIKIDPKNVEALTNLGHIYFTRGQIRDAFGALNTAYQLGEQSTQTTLHLANIYLAVGEYEKATPLIDRILQSNPENQEVPILLADSIQSKEKVTPTIKRLNTLLQQTPNNPALHTAIALLSLKIKDVEQAKLHLSKAIEADPSFAPSYSLKAVLSLASGDNKTAGTLFKKAASLAKPRSTQVLQYSDWLQGSVSIAEAKSYLEEVEKKAPDYIPLLGKLAQIAAAQDDFSTAKDYLKKLERYDSHNAEALLLKVKIQLHENENENALKTAEHLLKLYPNAPDAYYLIALAQLGLDKKSQAVVNLDKALQKNPKSTKALNSLIPILFQQGNYNDAALQLKAFLSQSPQDSQAKFLLAEAYRSIGDFSGALEIYNKLEIEFPKNEKIITLKGICYLLEENKDQAKESFLKALELNPSQIDALNQILAMDAAEENWEQAIARINNAKKSAPKDARILVMEARIYLSQKNWEQAEQSLIKSIELSPDSLPSYLLLANHYIVQDRIKEAFARLDEALEKNPQNIAALMLKATVLDQQKDNENAAEVYTKILSINPDFGPALNNLAYLYSERLNKLDEAFKLAKKVRELFPHDPYAADTLGWILIQKKDYKWGTSLIRESALSLPQHSEVLYHLGTALYLQGLEKEAQVTLQKSIENDNSFPQYSNAKQYLAILEFDEKNINKADLAILIQATQESENPIALIKLAKYYQSLGNDDEAIKRLKQTLKIIPNNSIANARISQIYFKNNQLSQATEHAQLAYKESPKNSEVISSLAQVAFANGEFSWCYSLLKDHSRTTALNNEDAKLLTLAEFASGQTNTPSNTILTAKLAPTNPVSLYNKNIKIEDRIKAIEAWKNLLEKWPSFAPAQLELALLYIQDVEDFPRATQMITKAQKNYSQNGDIDFIQGVLAYNKQNYTQAKRLLERCLKNTRQTNEAQRYLDKTNSILKSAP